jgi:hypothetical protein
MMHEISPAGNEARVNACKKKNPSGYGTERANLMSRPSSRTKRRVRRHMNLLRSIAVEEASSKSAQISEIASRIDAGNDTGAVQSAAANDPRRRSEP